MTEQVNVGGAWRMREADSETWHSAHVPGSVYADLMADGTMPDPFWRENELDAFERMKKDYVYQRAFTVTEAQLAHAHVELVCEGLDTLALLKRPERPAAGKVKIGRGRVYSRMWKAFLFSWKEAL